MNLRESKTNTVELFLDSIDVSTRGKRRKATMFAVELLDKIRHAEERYMETIPINLRSGAAYFEADYTVDTIINAIFELLGALDP